MRWMTPLLYCCNRPQDNADVKVVAVDLQAMAPLDGIIQLQGDITKVSKGFF